MAQLKSTIVAGDLSVTGQINGTLNDTTIANGDCIVIIDSSDGNKMKKSEIAFDGSTTTKFLNQKGTWSTVSTSDEKVKVTARGTTKAYLLASTSATSNGTTAVAESDVYLGTTAGHLYATAVHNAVWNDYAEYRRTAESLKPGNVIIDNDDGTVSLATQRLLPGAQVVSDTWGHIMGETDEAKTPVAVAGRVLVYTYQNRTNYHAGMAVCSAPNGTVDIMTREEIKEYPDCIIGYVSEIPNYETWGSGNVKVDGRIWVRVK